MKADNPGLCRFPNALYGALLLICSTSPSASSQSMPLDDFETLSGWKPVTSHGDASKMSIAAGEGKTGKGMLMEFSFLGYMGSASAEKKFGITLPKNYQISFDVRGEAPINNFVIRLMDSLDNVWTVNRTNFEFPRRWTKMTVKKHQMPYGWGPSGGGELHVLDRIMLMIDVVEGGQGKVWIDNLTVEPIAEGKGGPSRVDVSSVAGGDTPHVQLDGKAVVGWRSSGKSEREWLTVDFPGREALGGLVIDWDSTDYATAYDVLLSDDGRSWTKAYGVFNGSNRRSYIFLRDGEGKKVKLNLEKSSRGKGYGITRLEFKGPDFGFSINDFFGALAADSPKGFYPKYLRQQQSYWTVVGAAADSKEALINEQGMIETDKLSFSLEPFLYLNGRLVTWSDATITQSLEKECLPIPAVHWDCRGGVRLTVQALADGPAGKSVLLARYAVENRGTNAIRGKLFVAVRPFQVNPPWQTFTIIGGAARVDSIRYDSTLKVNRKEVIPVTRPTACGAAEFDQGHVTEYLRQGEVPPSTAVHDHFGYASAALQYDVDLRGGESREIVVAVPFHGDASWVRPNMDDPGATALYKRAFTEAVRFWESKLNHVGILLPPSAPPIANTIKSNIAYVLINADGPGTQPGSRSYERSWIRDGALTSAALLQMGLVDEVRKYLDWYAGYQYSDGKIPCIVESRGPEPTPEHDSHGQFIYAIMQYFHFTHDTTWLRGKWSNVVNTVRYVQSLRAQRKTDVYRHGTPEQRACYGLVPESISHEGYCPKPMHSYWDDFFVMRGLKDAAAMAEILGEKKRAREFAAERDDFRKDLYNSMRQTMKMKNITFIPGCVELGDFSGLSTTIGISPCDELGNIPEPELTYTFDESYRMFLERKNNAVVWDAYLPYEARFVGAYVFLDRKERALDILEYLMHDRRPQGWNHWAEVVWKDPSAPRSIGDMPHSWAASDFIRSVRSMLVYERETDETLVVGAGLPGAWVADPSGVSVVGMPTYYGRLSYSMKKSGDQVIVELSGDLAMPKGKILVRSPLRELPKSVAGDAKRGADPRDAIVSVLPARVVFSY